MTHVYRLHVERPPEMLAHGWRPPDWDEFDERGPFAWREPHLYLSKSGAEKRADLLRLWGATVTVERSRPVTWPGDDEDWELPEDTTPETKP